MVTSSASRQPRQQGSLLLALASLLLPVGIVCAADPDISATPDQLKVAFTYNFSRYFTWPADGKWNSSDFFDICVAHRDVAGGEFASLAGEQAQGKTIRIRELGETPADVAGRCHIWYVDAASYPTVQPLLAALSDSDVLVVSDLPGATQNGAVVELVSVDNRMRFRVSTANAAARGLSASSFLLRLALPEGR